MTDEHLPDTGKSPYDTNIITHLALEANAEIEQGSVTITVSPGNPDQEIYTEPTPADGTLVGDGGGTGTINYVTGEITLIAGSGWGGGSNVRIDFNYWPALPCMGIHQLELRGINAEQTIAFDTVYVYYWDTTDQRFEEINVPNTQTFTGTNSQFFWTLNTRTGVDNGGTDTPRSVFLVTNFNQGGDQVYLYDREALTADRWQQFSPRISATPVNSFLEQSLMLVNFKGRVVALNTWEGTTLAGSLNYSNRARWCRNGDFLDTLVMADGDVWRHDIQGYGGYIDAPTSEAIVSAAFVRDSLIVGFERSTWRLRYTANELLPFVWEIIDSEFGDESTFSPVRMDKGKLSVGQKGIIACDAINVERIDTKIPDEVFRIHNENEGNTRVHGIRDYDKQLVYWTYPDADLNRKYPDKVLVFNLENQAWSFFKDSLTCFGVLQEFDDRTWEDFTDTTWEQAQFAWVDTSLQSLYPDVIAGNQHGYIVDIQKLSRNDPGLAITVITDVADTPVQLTIPDHNLSTGEFIRIVGVLGTANVLNDTSYIVNVDESVVGFEDNITLSEYNSERGIFETVILTGATTYLGGGEMILLHDYRARMKKYNFLADGKSIEMGYIDFLLDQTTNGQFSVELYADHNDESAINNGADSFFNTTVQTEPYESDIEGQSKLLHRFFCRMHLQFLQFELNLSPIQKVDPQIHDSEINLYSITMWADQSGRLT